MRNSDHTKFWQRYAETVTAAGNAKWYSHSIKQSGSLLKD